MASILTPEDRKIIEGWRQNGALLVPDEQRLDLRHGLIAFPCSDGDQFCHVFDCLCALQTIRQRDVPRPHVLGYNGGLLELSLSFQKNPTIVNYWVKGFRWAMERKGFTTGVLIGHVVCSAARERKLSLIEQMGYCLEARGYLKFNIPELCVALLLQVDDGGKKEIYFVNRQALA